jgi:hypothetical protein
VSTDVKDDRRVVLTLPPGVPLGKTELIISIAPDEPQGPRLPRSSLADWADEHAEHWGERLRSTGVEGFTGRRTWHPALPNRTKEPLR